MSGFYDQLADDYHLIYADWHASSLAQGKALSAILEEELGPGPLRILDCACGIGTQTIGLATLGHNLTATDASPRAIDRARIEAQKAGFDGILFEVREFSSLGERFDADFEAVLVCDNALPHLLSEEEIREAGTNFHACLKPGGLLLISTRDYDRILAERPGGTLPGRTIEEGQQRIVFQVWDWGPDSTYSVDLFILRGSGASWEVKSMQTTSRAWRREELSRLIGQAGFRHAKWLPPEKTGFFQQILTARRR
jgi:2-polyprenyl-3-methyl-5-hydroxy-6-metoxy-1,4-benzoquinol methylase